MDEIRLYSKRVWFENRLMPATVIIRDGKIQHIDPARHPDAVDHGDHVIMPGLVDAHVHINEPGRTDWEGFETATAAAAAGGITMLADMPLNSSPVTTSVAALNEKIDASRGKLSVDVGFYGGIVPGNTDQIVPLANAGVLGFKCFLVHSGIDEFPNVTEKDLELAMPLIAKTGLPLLAHCELETVPAKNLSDDDPGNYQKYLRSRPGRWELDAVDMMIALARKHQCRIHIVHVSYAGALTAIRRSKADGLPVTAETCPHYILFNAEEINDGNSLFKCAPPIREKENNMQLIDALSNGTLDFIGTDHSPAPPDIKEIETGNLKKAWGGIAGLQFLLPASWTALRAHMSLEAFIPLVTSHPASFLSLQGHGLLTPGSVANLVVWNPEEEFQVEASMIRHRYDISPYAGKKLYGSVISSMVHGRMAFENGSVFPGAGQAILAGAPIR